MAMKRFTQAIIIIILLAAISYLVITGIQRQSYTVVKFFGVEEVSNASNGFLNQVASKNSQGFTALPLFDRELIIVQAEGDDDAIYYRYERKDGNMLEFRTEAFKTYLNNDLIHARIVNDPEILAWMKKESLEGSSSLRSVSVEDSLPEVFWEEIRNLNKSVPDLGILFPDTNFDYDELSKDLNPGWLLVSSSGDKFKLKAGQFGNMDLLFLSGEDLKIAELGNQDKLKQLLITDFSGDRPFEGAKLPTQLRSLLLSGYDLQDLDFLGRFKKLQHLSIAGSDIEMEKLAPYCQNLKSINLYGSKIGGDIGLLADMPLLTRITFPQEISQEKFDEVISGLTNLKIIELLENENVKSFSAIESHPSIKCLTLTQSKIDIDSLADLKKLKYLALTYSDEDSARVSALQDELPETVIIPTDGVCLGPGWLLLALPLLLLITLVQRFTGKHRARA